MLAVWGAILSLGSASAIAASVSICASQSTVQEPFLCALKAAVDQASPGTRVDLPSAQPVLGDRVLNPISANQSAAAVAAEFSKILSTAFKKGLTLSGNPQQETLINYSGRGNHPAMPETADRPNYALIVTIDACTSQAGSKFELRNLRTRNIQFRYSGVNCPDRTKHTQFSIVDSRLELFRPVYITPCNATPDPAGGCNLNTSSCMSYTQNSILSLRAMEGVQIVRSTFYRYTKKTNETSADPIGNAIIFSGVSDAKIINSLVYGRITNALTVSPTKDLSGAWIRPTGITLNGNTFQRVAEAGAPQDHGIYIHGSEKIRITSNKFQGFTSDETGYGLKLRNSIDAKISQNQFIGGGIALYTYSYPNLPEFEKIEKIQVSRNKVKLEVYPGKMLPAGGPAFEVVNQCMKSKGLSFQPKKMAIFYWSTLPASQNPEKSIHLSENEFEGNLQILSVSNKAQWSILDNHPLRGGTIQCPTIPAQTLPDLSGRIIPAFACR